MDLSIVIVNWNTREMLRDCLTSVFDGLGALQTEVWVVDNASADGSAEMVETAFPQVRMIVNDTNRGFAAANNQALALAQGRHVLLLNSDTVILGCVLSDSVAWLDAHPEVGVMGCRVLNADGSLQPTGSGFPSLLNLSLQATGLTRLPGQVFDRYRMERWDRRDTRAVDVVSGCYMLVRKTAMDEVGLLDEQFFFYGEETDWCRRYADAGWGLVLAPVGEIIHLGGGSVRTLKHGRDVLLTAGTVRLHHKHFGLLGGLACLSLLAAFNASRAVIWTLIGLFASGEPRARGAHFRAVTADLAQAWPTADTAKTATTAKG
jgi:GT2 family glycosyltransferase